MAVKINTLTFAGIEVVDIDTEVHIASGMPNFTIVGLPDKTIAESKERVRAAITSLGLTLPAKRIIINLAPADIFKEGSHFDLAIAVGLLTAMNIIPHEEISDYMVIGELGLDGSIRSVSGVLPASIGATARDLGIICPYANGKEAAWSGNKNILAPKNLISLINHFKGIQLLSLPTAEFIEDNEQYPDLSEVKGQEVAKRAVLIAASGSHNMLMYGPPGSGKSLLARCLAGVLPKMTAQEMLECSMISSIAGFLENGKIKSTRPFRSPHHSCSMPAMVGGGIGRKIVPGEISLAHNGVLFLDELPEFPRVVLDALRQPLETAYIHIARVNSHVIYPARFQLIAAMNPCRCGYLGDPGRSCSKAPKCSGEYLAKISGPIIDRIDMFIEVANINPHELNVETTYNQSSRCIGGRIQDTRNLQQERYKHSNIRTNAELNGELLKQFATPTTEGQKLLNTAFEKMKLSMRSYNRLLRVARTIADLENSPSVDKKHIAEALSYKFFASGN